MSIVAMMIQDNGLTLREVISDIPHDGPAMIVYVLIAIFVGFIWWGSRGDAGPTAGGPTSPSGSAHPPATGTQR